MHQTERERAIFALLQKRDGFVSFRELEKNIDASPATLRRDLGRLDEAGYIDRVRGGARLPQHDVRQVSGAEDHLAGRPFDLNVRLMPEEKMAIGRAAAALCRDGSSVMIDGGSTTLQMCQYLAGRNLQVFTNSLHIVRALLPQPDIKILLPGGSVFREQDIILSATGDDAMPRFHAPKFFMGAAAIGPQGIMNSDIHVVAAERRLIDRADELIVLVDHTKFHGSSGNVVCGLEVIDIVVTDAGVSEKDVAMFENAGTQVIIA
jgi:DeoR family ulaG and ulaABCDEF operon transcriptional repressor